MKVAQLIAELAKFPQEAVAFIMISNYDPYRDKAASTEEEPSPWLKDGKVQLNG